MTEHQGAGEYPSSKGQCKHHMQRICLLTMLTYHHHVERLFYGIMLHDTPRCGNVVVIIPGYTPQVLLTVCAVPVATVVPAVLVAATLNDQLFWSKQTVSAAAYITAQLQKTYCS